MRVHARSNFLQEVSEDVDEAMELLGIIMTDLLSYEARMLMGLPLDGTIRRRRA